MRYLVRLFTIVVVLFSIAIGTSPAAIAQRPLPSLDYQAHVIAYLTNSVGGQVLYRRGWWYQELPNHGFGFDKAYHKHGITHVSTVAQVVRYPDRVVHLGGHRWNHEKTLYLKDGSRVLDRRNVIVAIEYGDWHGRGQLGVVTAFCQNPDGAWKCPSWIP